MRRQGSAWATKEVTCSHKKQSQIVLLLSPSFLLCAVVVTSPKAAARCKLCIEALETCSESSFGSVSIPTDEDSQAREKDERQQQLVERYAALKNAMMDWGVEVKSAA